MGADRTTANVIVTKFDGPRTAFFGRKLYGLISTTVPLGTNR